MKYNCTPLQAMLRLSAPNALQLGNRMSERSEVGEARFVSSRAPVNTGSAEQEDCRDPA